jgi:hypothetical protein
MKRLYILILFVLKFHVGITQMKIAYSMGVVGADLNIRNANSTLLLNLNNCLQVSNGLSKFSIANSGEFKNNCIVNLNFTKLNIQVAPNPFTDFIYVTFKSKIDNDNRITLSIFNVFGVLQKKIEVLQNDLFNGYKIQLPNLPSGSYFLSVNSRYINETFKILKND